MRRAQLIKAQSAYYVATGIWPLVHLRSFEAITGPKASPWLVKTFGLLVAAVGGALAESARGEEISSEAFVLSAGTAAALAACDLVYVGKRRISPAYLVDALLHVATLIAWRAVSLAHDGQTSTNALWVKP